MTTQREIIDDAKAGHISADHSVQMTDRSRYILLAAAVVESARDFIFNNESRKSARVLWTAIKVLDAAIPPGDQT